MKSLIVGSVLLAGSITHAGIDQRDLTLRQKCLDQIVKAVEIKYGKDDETFSVQATKLLYGGSLKGLHIDPVVLVQTSDEVEPRDIIVITSIESDAQAEAIGCKVKKMVVVADGTTVDMPDVVPLVK
jgi:hypothetical protein